MHIAFVAMSGVRAASEELNRAGLTMPGFLERSQAIASLPSLALLTLAALTPDRFEVSYHEIEDIRTAGEPPASAAPWVCGCGSECFRFRQRSTTPTPAHAGA
jgi:hypothetical protein